MVRYKLAICLVFFVMLTTGILHTAYSQHYFARFYTEMDGLSSNMVYDVAQDTSGLIWFATRSGICSYDGKTWITYLVDQHLKSFSFPCIFADKKGSIWTIPFHSEAKIYQFSGNKWTLYACDTLHLGKAYFVAFDGAFIDDVPVFALGTDDQGLLIFHDKQWSHFSTKNGLLSNHVRDLKWVGHRLVVATNKGISVIQDGRVSNQWNDLIPVRSREIIALSPKILPGGIRSDTDLWLFGEGWLGSLSESAFTKNVSGFPFAANNLLSRSFIYSLPDGSIYFGNPFYLYFWSPFAPSLLEKVGRDNGLIADGATAVLTDREKNTWITGFRGISKISSRRFTYYTSAEGLFDNEVSSALEISPGSYVFGHHGALTFLHDQLFESISLYVDSSKGLPEVRVQDMALDQDKNIWVAASTLGIAKIDQRKQVTWYNPGDNENFASIVALPEGRIFACSDKKLFIFNKALNRFVETPLEKMKDLGMRKLFPGQDSSLIIATYSTGICQLKGQSETIIKFMSNELANNVYAYFEDSRGNRWVGSVIGLYKILNNQFIKVDDSGFRIDRPVFLILEDLQGKLWFGTDNGIYRWDGKILDHYTKADGICGQEINRDAGFVDQDGNIWFGTNFGVTCYHPGNAYVDDSIPKPIIRLEWFEVNGDTFSCHHPVTLPNSANNLTFSFRALSFIDEDKLSYAVKLEGFDEEWSAPFSMRDGQYRYNNLLPGRYTFYVKACNAIGIWSDPVSSATIKIRVPVYIRWWFILFACSLVFTMFFLVFRFAMTKRYNLRLEKMVAIKTRELRRSEKKLQESNAAKDNFFSIIAHDLKSPFNAILGMLELLTTEYHEFSDEERQRILLNLRNSSTRTINLIENLLTWAQAQKGILPFEPEKFDLMELVAENLLLFESAAKAKNIQVIRPPQNIILVYADRNMINTVIRNLLSNAIKFTYDKGKVTLSILHDHPENVIFSIEDTGQGMEAKWLKNLFKLDRKTTSKGTNNETGTGLGLILSKDFITRNNGHVWVTSEVEKGTTFFFSLPVKSQE